jgi:hypothetical protein
MKTHRLLLEDVFEEEYQVIAIYCQEQSYRMAFLLNTCLGTQFQKTTDILNQKMGCSFQLYEYHDKNFYRNWFLLSNHSSIEKQVSNSQDLFTHESDLFEQKVYYLNELKKATYLLKIEAEESIDYYNDIVKKIALIPQVYVAELVLLTRIKNKKLLIF